jgi:ATP-dependent DNA helicase RecG
MAKPQAAHGSVAAVLAPAGALPGVGPAVLRLLRRLTGRDEPRLIDLLAHAPSGMLDPTPVPHLTDAHEGRAVAVDCRIGRHRPPGHGHAVWRIAAEASGYALELVLFNVRGDWPRRRFPEGAEMRLHGRVTRRQRCWQMAHPEVLPGGNATPLPLYPLTEGLTQARLRRLIGLALGSAPHLPEWLDPPFAQRQGFPAWQRALHDLHAPWQGTTAERPGRRRLAFDELLASQLALQHLRQRREQGRGRATRAAGLLRERLLGSLPFTPTRSQTRAVAEILADMAAPAPMLRLLMGDVGSGKTLVALMAMLEAVESGGQAALMAPTEVLARQHAASLSRLAAPVGLGVELLTGGGRNAARRRALAAVASGEVPLVVGTHALFQAGVAFADLALAVVDEQHRFGVHQRLHLRAKGAAVDMLLMTATPIPRTLLMSAYGDIATSCLTEKPAGRRPIATAAVPLGRLDEVVAALGRALARNERAYWICPLIGDTAGERAAVEARAEALRRHFGNVVGAVHGRMTAAAKDAAMRAFAAGAMTILVATTVIEVGVDVPEASVIVIEEAERFGLAQLHQLRGRVGRGDRPSHCLLLYGQPLSAVARERLRVLRRTADGFRIAEEDLRLRGPGEVLGTRQSGLPDLLFADLSVDADLLAAAHDDARLILQRDPSLTSRRGRALRQLLALFERDRAMLLPGAG